MFRLPPPTTFAEGMRLLFALAAMLAGLAFGLGATATVIVLVWGGWPATLYPRIISILGWTLIGALLLIAITQIGILLGGPVGRFRGQASLKGGVDLEASGNDQVAPKTQVTTTVTTGGQNGNP